MKPYWQSWTGWAFMATYLILAGFLFHQALSCRGWVCDLVALPAAFPFGFPVAWLIDWIDYMFRIPGHTPTFHFSNWYFIIPTVLINAVFYYWIGKQLEALLKHLLRRSAKQR